MLIYFYYELSVNKNGERERKGREERERERGREGEREREREAPMYASNYKEWVYNFSLMYLLLTVHYSELKLVAYGRNWDVYYLVRLRNQIL